MKQDHNAIRSMLVEKVTELCETCLTYNAQLQVEGLLGLTFDHGDVVLVNINKILPTTLNRQQSQVIDLSVRSTNNGDSNFENTNSIKNDKKRSVSKSHLSGNKDVCIPGMSTAKVVKPPVLVINTDDDYTTELGCTEMEELPFPVDSLLNAPDFDVGSSSTGFEQTNEELADSDDGKGVNRKSRKRKRPCKVLYPQLRTLKSEHPSNMMLPAFETPTDQFSSRLKTTVVKDEPIEAQDRSLLVSFKKK